MSDMKCPVCKTGNVEQGKHDKEYFCDNEFCQSYDETDSKTYDILIRTRKALDVAKDKLDTVRQYHRGTAVICPDDIAAYCDRAIEQITALEQKDK